MMRKIKISWFTAVLSLATLLCLSSSAFAQEKDNIGDRIIGSTFKALAKAVVAVADINRLKKNNIKKLGRMKEGKFNREYAKVYEVIKGLPEGLKARYGIIEHMRKEQAIKGIESFNRENMYEVIDALPDAMIANEFKRYLSDRKQKIQESNVCVQIHKFWDKVINKINMPAA